MHVDGEIRDVLGGGPENKIMRRSLARTGAHGFGHIVHFTCGFHPAARSTGACLNEDFRVMGANAVGLGIPSWHPGGGENHPDCIVSMQSLWIGQRQLMDNGVIVGPSDILAMASKLQPILS